MIADLAPGEASGEPSQYGELGRTGFFNKFVTAGVDPIGEESLLDRRRDGRQPAGIRKLRDRAPRKL